MAMTILRTGRRRAVLVSSAFGVTGLCLAAAQAAVLTPLYLRAGSPDLYGAWLASGEVLTWLMGFDFGVGSLLIQRIAAAQSRTDSVAALSFAGLLVLGGVGALTATTGTLIAPYVGTVLGLSGRSAQELVPMLRIASLAAGFQLASIAGVAVARGTQSVGQSGIASVVSTLLGFGASGGVLAFGGGLVAAPVGLLVRAIAFFCFSTWQAIRAAIPLPPYRAALREVRCLARLAPSNAIGSMAYLAMNQVDLVVVSTLLGPAAAVPYALTRRLADFVKAGLDTIAYGSFGAFASIAAEDPRRAIAVRTHLVALRSMLATAALACYILLNRSVVSKWVGAGQFGGQTLTLALAAQVLIAGGAYLENNLLRAAGAHSKGSMFLLAEAAIRMPLMLGGVSLLGPIGLPLAAITTSAVFGHLAKERTRFKLGASASGWLPTRPAVLTLLVATLSLGASIQASFSSWVYMLVAAISASGLVVLLFLALDKRLVSLRTSIVKRVSFITS